MTAPRYDPQTGSLFVSERGFLALRAVVEAGERDPDYGELQSLAAAGAIVDGRPHETLAAGLATVAAPIVELGLERGPARGRGWVDADRATLLVPAPEGLYQLIIVPTMFTPEALARLNDLGPRPRAEPALRMRFGAGELARMLAARDASPLGLTGHAERRAVRSIIEGLRMHWRVEARWPPAPGFTGVRVVEVLDTDGGVWVVVPDGSDVELWSATPTAVWRQLSRLLPADGELQRS